MSPKGTQKLLERLLRRHGLQVKQCLYDWKTADQRVEKFLNCQGNHCFIETVLHLDHVEKFANLEVHEASLFIQPFGDAGAASILIKEIRENQK